MQNKGKVYERHNTLYNVTSTSSRKPCLMPKDIETCTQHVIDANLTKHTFNKSYYTFDSTGVHRCCYETCTKL